MNKVPFVVGLGKNPPQKINRLNEMNEIESSFQNFRVSVLKGPHGSGKTILLRDLETKYRKRPDWIVIVIHPEVNLLEQFASLLYEEGKAKCLSFKSKFSFEDLDSENSEANATIFIKEALNLLKKKGKKVLIGIDEASISIAMSSFYRFFNGLVQEDYPIYLIMTSCLDEFCELRYLKICLSPLNEKEIAASYRDILGCDEKQSIFLASLTGGYAIAYQILGYLLWKANKKEVDPFLLNSFDALLASRIYEKIWSEMLPKEREIAHLLAKGRTNSQEIVFSMSIEEDELSECEFRMKEEGIIEFSSRGVISFLLPRFSKFVLSKENKD